MPAIYMYVHNNPEIYKTSVTINGQTFSAKYEDYDDEGFGVAAPDVDLVFEAEPSNGYIFTRWVYRTGSITATQQYSYNNPFTYTDKQDIYIRAEGQINESGEDQVWTLDKIEVDDVLSEDYSTQLSLSSYCACRLKVKFANSGTAMFYTSGNIDTLGFFTTSAIFDDELGAPKRYLATDNQSGTDNNFSISYDVEADKTYYIYVRCNNATDIGSTKLHISVPNSGAAIGGSGLYILVSKGTSSNPYLEWVKATPHILTSIGGYLHWEPVTTNVLTSEGGWLHWASDGS